MPPGVVWLAVLVVCVCVLPAVVVGRSGGVLCANCDCGLGRRGKNVAAKIAENILPELGKVVEGMKNSHLKTQLKGVAPLKNINDQQDHA